MTSAEADTNYRDMNLVLIIIFVVNLCLHAVAEARTEDATLAATTTSRIDTQNSGTGSDDVSCTTLDDVIAARRSLCPVQCRCSPLEGEEVLTKLTVNCSGADYNHSSAERLLQQLEELLSRCASELTELTITYTPLIEISQVFCNLSKLRSLDLSVNRLTWLPSNCFTRMRNLTYFWANYNLLAILQVRSDVNRYVQYNQSINQSM